MNKRVIAQVRDISATSRDGNEVKLDVVFDPSVAIYDRVPVALLRALKNEVAISFDLVFCCLTISFPGFVTAIKPTASGEDELTALVTIRIADEVALEYIRRSVACERQERPGFLAFSLS